MSITTSCVECKQKMVDGVLEHTKECSANHFKTYIGTATSPPALKLTFDTPEEQKKFMDNLGTSSGRKVR